MTSSDISTPLPRPLGTSYSKNGYDYTQIVRDGCIAIFGQHSKVDPENYIAYEVIRILVKPAIVIMGKEVPLREIAPSNEDWGKYGWTMSTLSSARTKMTTLVAASSVSKVD